MKKRVALSWSGGKDSCLALGVLIKLGIDVVCLVTTVPEEIGRTFGHGEKAEMIRLQGEALEIPVEFISCTFDNYTESFVDKMNELKMSYQLDGIAFGDLYLDGHREWGETLAKRVGIEAIYPLWMKQGDVLSALETFVHSGYNAVVIKVRNDVLDESWLGRLLDRSFIDDVSGIEMCPMGESGEYHTFVYDGPLFKKKIFLDESMIVKHEASSKLEFGHFELLTKE